MTKRKSCYRKAHSGTTQFVACQTCSEQDVCETDYVLGTSLCIEKSNEQKEQK